LLNGGKISSIYTTRGALETKKVSPQTCQQPIHITLLPRKFDVALDPSALVALVVIVVAAVLV
jgi:hypothetical protein